MIGYNNIKTNTGVYFTILKNQSYTTAGSIIPYEVSQLNIGGAMLNISTGVFTAPTSGRYFFSFTAISGAPYTGIALRQNQVTIGQSWGLYFQSAMPISATLNLNQGDQVDTLLTSGSIFDNENRQTLFTGVLLEQGA